jgi:hypothetical protein
MGKVDCAGELKENQKPYSCQIAIVWEVENCQLALGLHVRKSGRDFWVCWLGICFCAIFDKKQLSCLLTYFAILLVIFLQKFICTSAQLTDHRWVLAQLQGEHCDQ